MKFLIMIAIFFSLGSQAQNVNDQISLSKSGQIFTVKLTPGEKHLTVDVVGSKALDLKWEDTGLQAFLIVGKNMTPLKVVKSQANFLVEAQLPKSSEVRLDISNGKNHESLSLRPK